MDQFNEEELPELQNTPEPESDEPQNPTMHPIAAAFLGLVGCFFLYQFVGGIITILIFGTDMESAPVTAVRLMTIAGQALFILLPALVLTKMVYTNVEKIIRIRLPDWKEFGLFTIGILILTPLLQSYLYVQNFAVEALAENSAFFESIKSAFDYLDELMEKTYGNLLSADSLPEMIFVVITIAIVPALAEETLFRGFIQRSFEQKIKPFYAALITAIFFGLYHFNPYGLIPLIILALYFGFAAYKSKSIIIPIFLHFLNNFIAVVLFYSIGDDDIIDSSVSVPTDSIYQYLLVMLFLTVIFLSLIFIIRKYYLQKKLV